MLSTGVFIVIVRVALAAVFLFSGLAKLVSPQPAAAFAVDILTLSASTYLALVLLLSAAMKAISDSIIN
jgi:uncharacterized membrane protein YphA (DoxX/SURF4 family)